MRGMVEGPAPPSASGCHLPNASPQGGLVKNGKPLSSSGKYPLVPRASLISRSLSGPIRDVTAMPKRRTAEGSLPGTP
jgi:hypothetical protein